MSDYVDFICACGARCWAGNEAVATEALELVDKHWSFLAEWYRRGFGAPEYQIGKLGIFDETLKFAHDHLSCGFIAVRGNAGGSVYGTVVTGEARA